MEGETDHGRHAGGSEDKECLTYRIGRRRVSWQCDSDSFYYLNLAHISFSEGQTNVIRNIIPMRMRINTHMV